MKKKRKIRQFTCILIVISALLAYPGLPAYAREKAPGLPKAETAVRQLIEEYRERTPALSVTVFEGDRDICTVIYGEADREAHIAADSDTVYEWGSVSKMLVWVSAMQLYEQGKLDLNADVRTYLPEDFADRLFFRQPVTMLDLMNHSAGFQDALRPLETSDPDGLMPLDAALLDTEPAQVRKPGMTVAYSNWGAAFAGYVVECISGMPFADYVRENIFAPLHMEHTYIRPDASDHPWAAEKRKRIHCYAASGTGMQELGECRAYIHLYPAGAAGGTIADMAAFAKAFLCDSAHCPLFEKPDTLDIMLSPSLCYADGTPRICHGLFVQEYGVTLLGHGGNTSGFSTLLQIDPEGKTGFVMMTNTAGDAVYKKELPQRLYGDYDFAPEDTDDNTYDFSGKYYISGNACEGPAGFYDFWQGTLHIKKKNGAYVGNRGITTIIPLADGTARVELQTGATYRYHLQKDDKGNVVRLQNKSVDFEKLDKTKVFANYIATGFPAVSFVLLIVLMPLHLVSVKRSRREGCLLFRVVEISIGVFTLLIGADLYYMAQTALSDRSGMVLACVTLMVLETFTGAGLLFCHCPISGFARAKKKPTDRAGLMLETVCYVIFTAGICYWKFYQFWGY